MRASELRINNYVMLDDGRNDGEIIMITGTNAINGGHVYDEDDGIYGCNMIQPIPLTEQWLLDFGFKIESLPLSKADVFTMGVLQLVKVKSSEKFDVYVGVQRVDNGEKIKHVHQIQNFYFALTGEELTIKEKV